MHTHELYLDDHDVLYGEHLWYEGDRTGEWGHYVWRRTPDGEVTRVIPVTKGFLTGYSFVRDRAGNMYWAGGGSGDAGPRVQIVKRTPDGRATTLAGGASAAAHDGKGTDAAFTGITWMTAAPDGTVFVIDGAAVRRVSRDGVVTTLAKDLRARTPATFADRLLTAAGVAGRHHLMGLWPDGSGGVYVANQGARIVEHVDRRGGVMTVYEAPAPHAPTGVTVARGSLYVLEFNATQTARVARVPLKGPTSRPH